MGASVAVKDPGVLMARYVMNARFSVNIYKLNALSVSRILAT